jgi:hypothetical protein
VGEVSFFRKTERIMTRINLKRVVVWLSLVLLSTLTVHSQTLCVIDGTPIPDSLLHVTIDEMRSDSAKQIVAKRLGFIPSQAIESIQIFSAEEQIEQGKYIIFCKTPKDIIFIRTNSLAELQWVINGKLKKPRKKLTIIDYKLSPQRIMAALPKDINSSDIVSVDILTYTNDPRLERHPTIVIKTKRTAPFNTKVTDSSKKTKEH